MQSSPALIDARYFQVIFQLIFLCYGLLFLHWPFDGGHYFISIAGCLLFNYLFESYSQKQWLNLFGAYGFNRWGFSVLISAMSLCLLLKTDFWLSSLLAAFLTVASKYFFRIGHKHIFNPSAFGIVATIFITGNAWLSPAQWGSNAVIFFFVITLGAIVVTRVQKLDVSLAFLITYVLLIYWRQVMVLGWPIDHFIHSISTGSILLFTFFMISDPRTAPNHAAARIVWAIVIAALSFYLAAFKWQYNTAIWVLVLAAPLVPLLDMLFKASAFQWSQSKTAIFSFFTIKKIMMKPFTKKATAAILLLAMVSQQAMAFCGFYVSKADGTLTNKTSQVILVRDGNKNVITMYNDFKGKFKDFAMVVPVPVVLQQQDIKVVDQQIFQTLNDYSKPRLVEYYDQNPCNNYDMTMQADASAMNEVVVSGFRRDKSANESKVTIEAQYIVGEYDILILSAKESSGLKTWLDANGYKMPKGAEEVLEPYIKSNLKFFVVKVNEKELKKMGNNFLRPIQIAFESPKFMLPIRLGMANADGDQDMLVYAFTKKGRVESINYRTVSLPTGNHIPLFVKDNFGNFYSNLFQHQWKKEGRSVAMLEYAWDVSPKNFMKCDPCVATAPSQQDLVQAGVWWMGNDQDGYRDINTANVYFTRLHIRYNRSSFPQDIIFQATPNTENFQARYVVTHPATGNFSCDAGKQYIKALKERRKDEMEMLSYLTGKGYDDWDMVSNGNDANIPAEASYQTVAAVGGTQGSNPGLLLGALGATGLLLLVRMKRKHKP